MHLDTKKRQATRKSVIIENKEVRLNGFTPPLNRYQLISWVYFISSFWVFVFLDIPANLYFFQKYMILWLCIFGILSLGVTVFAFLTTKLDPTDRNVKYEKEWKRNGVEPKEFLDLNFFCDVCDVFVHDRTKHWGDWNRWWELFDHHWVWLNNWVGAKNYREFIFLIVFLFLQTLMQMLFSTFSWIGAILSPSKMAIGFIEIYDSSINNILVVWVASAFIILNFWVMIFTSSILLLHIKLYKIDFTAYEYLLYQRDRKERFKDLKSGVISQKEFDEENKQAFADIQKIKRSKIIHEVKRRNKAKDGVINSQEKQKDKIQKDFQNSALYYCISSKLWTAWTHRVERSRREESIIRESQLKSKSLNICLFDIIGVAL